MPFWGTRVGPVHSGVGRQGGRGLGCRGRGQRSRVVGLNVNRLLLLGGWTEVGRPHRGRSRWRSSSREQETGEEKGRM